jgi:hypothetical protein
VDGRGPPVLGGPSAIETEVSQDGFHVANYAQPAASVQAPDGNPLQVR